jgi:hypothetical protein
MSKNQKIRPENALKLQEEIEAYLRLTSGADLTPFEQRLRDALSTRDSKFFNDMAEFCQMGSNQWHLLQASEQQLRWLAVQARTWLTYNKKPVTREAIRKLTVRIWSARLIGYKPDGVFVKTSRKTLKLRIIGKGETPVTFDATTERPPGNWSELDYITALQSELEVDANSELRDRLDKAARGFPKTAWKRVWKDPHLSDIKADKGRPASN